MTNTTTKPVTFKSDLLGTVVLHSYVDPYPGAKNTDRRFGRDVAPCHRCGGTGIYSHYHGVCYRCMGRGTEANGITVGTLRKYAKAEAFATEYAAELAAARAVQAEAAAAAQAAADFAADWDAAHAEDARRAAMVQGFLGEVGEKVTGTGTVQVAKYIAGSWNRSSSMFLVIKLVSGQVVKTFGSGASLMNLGRGDQVEITGAVKAHESYQGQEQTVLTRAKATVLDEA